MIDLSSLLNKYPWEEKWKNLGKPMDFLWEFDLWVRREELWPYLIDTSSFNKRLGLPKFQYSEINGTLYGKTKQAGFQLEWEEVPWEWIYLKEIGNARIYKKGFGHYIRSIFLLEPLGESRCKVYVYFGWIPKNFFMRKLLAYAMPKLERQFAKGFSEVEEEIRGKRKRESNRIQKSSLFLGETRWLHSEKLEQMKPTLIQRGITKETVDTVFDWLLQTSDNEVDRIRTKEIAKKFSLDEDEVLFLFLHACRLGLFTLSWDVVCPHCRGVRNSVQKLGELIENETCEVCDIDFETTAVNSIEVTFHFHPSIRIVEKQLYCAAEPKTKEHILLTKKIPGNKSFSAPILVSNGTYRLRIKGEKQYTLVDVKSQSDQKDILWLPETKEQELAVAPEPNLVFENESNSPVTIVLEGREEDQYSLRPRELFDYQEFRDLFSEEAIATNLQLDIGIKTILFTDIVGSTRFYETEGDHGAFLQVREHFVKTSEILNRERGVLVKTIGDAVMASFPSPLYALRAAKEMQEWFHPENKHTQVKIRITIHTGNCLAVHLDSNIDYFGNTVNYTAKMQALVGSGEIGFSETIFRDPQVRDYLRENQIKLRRVDFPLPWAGKTDQAYLWKV